MTAVPEQPANASARLALRPPEQVMRLGRLGSFFSTRLSFMRSLLRRIAREEWTLAREQFALDERGFGHAVYRLTMPQGVIRLVAFSHDLAPEDRTDRVIAEKWDSTFALTTAEPTSETIERLRANVPLQEVGRCSPREFVLSRANKSVRLFDHVVDCLANGHQPEAERLVEVGYLMRTTAVYGNGKYGLSDLPHTFGSGLFARPFEAELLTVYLIREFTFDLVEHLARRRAPDTVVPLAPETRRMLGIGNATGLGMAPFLIGHPILIDRWMSARETAIARVRAVERTTPETLATFAALLRRAIRHIGEWRTDDGRQMDRILLLRQELPPFAQRFEQATARLATSRLPWESILDEAWRTLSVEGQELVNSLILEPHGALVDDLEDTMAADEHFDLDPTMTVGALRRLIEEYYAWALGIDYDDPIQQHLFWYVSEEKLEPRLGERFAEPGAELELRLGIGREVSGLYKALEPALQADRTMSVAAFLLANPEQRHIARRIQTLASLRYAEIRDNVLARDTIAVDLLRCKLSMFGAAKFDPKSDRWTRITMYQGAPSFAALDPVTADDWAFPVFLDDPANAPHRPA